MRWEVSRRPATPNDKAARSGAALHKKTRGSGGYFAACTMISTLRAGLASLASTVARAGELPGDTQAYHTSFIWPKVTMSVSQLSPDRIFGGSAPAVFRTVSIL